MDNEVYNYTWSGGSFEAIISKHPRRNEWRWNVKSVNNDYINFSNHIDVELESAKEAEDDMMFAIQTHIGSTPQRQV
jgi:hypothetical protein